MIIDQTTEFAQIQATQDEFRLFLEQIDRAIQSGQFVGSLPGTDQLIFLDTLPTPARS
jgi:hypothetical protein